MQNKLFQQNKILLSFGHLNKSPLAFTSINLHKRTENQNVTSIPTVMKVALHQQGHNGPPPGNGRSRDYSATKLSPRHFMLYFARGS